MHYVTSRSHWMPIHKFNVTCPVALLVGHGLGPPEHEQCCIDVSCPGRIRTYYMAYKLHWIQKHKFCVMTPETFFVGSAPGPPDHEK
jgi:hypothetical protein